MFAPFKAEPLFLQSSAASQAHANEILPGLWLGDAHASQDADFFQRNNIGAVLNATKDLPIKFNVEWMRIPVDDNLKQEEINNMCAYLPHAASMIYKNYMLDQKSILVHCAAGMQRSATIIAYFLHSYLGYSMQDAMALIVSKRPVAFFGGKFINFRQCLGL